MRLLARLLVAITLAFAPLLPTVRAADPAPPPATYQALIAQAQALAHEESWDRAQKLYVQALALAPDAEARRWCELWLEDTTWHSGADADASRDARIKRHFAIFSRLEQPYQAGRPHDEFWIALLTSGADFEDHEGTDEAIPHYLAIADELAGRPPGPSEARRYVEFVRSVIEHSSALRYRSREKFREHLAQGACIAATADDRAWCLWQIARLSYEEYGSMYTSVSDATDASSQRWTAALSAAAGTRWETPIRANEFLWRITSSWAPDLPPNTPADVPGILAELDRVRAAVGSVDPYHLSSQLKDLEKGLREPKLTVSCPAIFRPNTPIQFVYGTSGLAHLECVLERISPATRLHYRQYFFRDESDSDEAQPADGELIRAWRIDLPDPHRLAWKSEIVEASAALAPGLYALTVRGENGPAHVSRLRLITVTSLDGIAMVSRESAGRIFVFHAADQSPVSGAGVTGWRMLDQAPRSWEAVTDANGSAAVPVERSSSSTLIALIGGDPVVFEELDYHREPYHTPVFLDVFTDRPVFQPGDTAHWKLVVRERRGGKFVIPASDPELRFSFRHNDAVLVAPAPLKLGPLGTVDGEIKLPPDLRPGSVRLVVARGTTTLNATPLFEVDHYVPPEITAKLEVIGEHLSLTESRSLRVRLTANYFSGEPVANAPVRITFSPMPQDIGTGHPPSREPILAWIRSLADHPSRLITDASGIVEATCDIPGELNSPVWMGVSASLQPEGARDVSAHTQIMLTRSGYVLDPGDWTSPRWYRPSETVPFSAIVRNALGAPAPFTGRAQLTEIRWSEVWLDETGHQVPDAVLAAMRARPKPERLHAVARWQRAQAGYLEFPVEDRPVRAGADGRIEAPFNLPRAGVFRLRLFPSGTDTQEIHTPYDLGNFFAVTEAEDDESSPSRGYLCDLCVIACDEHTSDLALDPEKRAVLVEPPTRAGQPIRTLVIAPSDATRAWLALVGEDHAEGAALLLSGRATVYTFERPPTFRGNGVVTLALDSLFERAISGEFKAPATATPLHLTIQPTAAQQRPGSPAALTILAQDAAGQPAVGSEIAVSIADEAVDSLMSSRVANKSPSFLSAKSRLYTDTAFARPHPSDAKAMSDPRNGAIRHFVPGADLGQGAVFGMGRARGLLMSEGEGPPPTMVDISAFKQSLIPTILPQELLPEIVVRRHFASTAFWAPSLVADARGEVHLTFTYPDNLTQWRIGAYAIGPDGNSFGDGKAFTRTSLPLQARLSLPRFAVDGDALDISATLLNHHDREVRASAELTVSGPISLAAGSTRRREDLTIGVQAETHPSWALHTTGPGDATFTLVARTDHDGDGMVQTLPVLADDITQEIATSARLAPDIARTRCTLALPATLDPARTQVTVQLSPSPAIAVLDALPYLIDYPYGCTEQTMSRFLPAVVVRQFLLDHGFDAAAVEKRILATETPADAARRETTAGLHRIDDVVKSCLTRLADGTRYRSVEWWPGGERDLWMTGYVAWGYALAQKSGVPLDTGLLARSADILNRAIGDQDAVDDRAAFAFCALAQCPDRPKDPRWQQKLQDRYQAIYAAKDRLSAYGRACLALAAPVFATPEQRAILVRNLDNGVERAAGGDFGELAHWGKTEGYWRATDGAVETTALTLLALLELDPKNPLIEPAANWLLLNRRGIHWSNTRETAFAVLALTRYLHDRGGLDASGEVDVLVNGAPVQHVKFAPGALLETPLRVEVPVKFLRPGENQIELRRTAGTSPVYLVAVATSWVSGREVKPAGSLVHVGREFIHQKATPTLVGTLRITPEPLGPNGTAVAGNEVMARVTIDCPSELEYVMVEVPKPAGCEPLNPLSGWDAHLVRPDDKDAADDGSDGNEAKLGRAIYREEYDDKSVFFIDHLAAGRSEIRFGMRATTRGDFRALPAKVEAMYVPEIRANSDARRLKITAAP